MIGEICDLGRGFWKKNRLASGKEIDSLRGQNIPFNSKTIDRTEGLNVAIGHKSTDIRLKSYVLPSAVYRIGMRYVRQLALYTGEVRRDLKKKATYHLHWAVEAEGSKQILEWFIPLEGVANEQEVVIHKVVTEAVELGVDVRVFRVAE